MNKSNLYIDFHVLQTVPPSCINRDDTGSPKTAQFGGVTRARVSSQSWKRAMRLMFQNEFDRTKFGVRTKGIVELVAEKIIELDKSKEKEANKLALNGLKNLFGKDIKEKDGIKALFFISHKQATNLADLIIKEKDSKEKLQNALLSDNAIDIALFGRMVAIMPNLNVDAAAQVSHSISTHEVKIEYDYFTAIDDMADKETNGAAHLDVNEFDSATLYRYSTINIRELENKLGEDTIIAIKAFAKAFIYSMPTGKENSYANCSLPEMVYITVRNDQPVNMVGAFEKPIVAGRQGFFIPSEETFVKYAERTYQDFVSEPDKSWGTSRGEKLSSITRNQPINKIIEEIGIYVKEKLDNGLELS